MITRTFISQISVLTELPERKIPLLLWRFYFRFQK